MADGHVVGGEKELMLAGFPNGHSPIADQATEAVGLPTIEGRSDDGNVGQVGFEIAPKIGNQRGPIVEAAVPGEDMALSCHQRLLLLPRLSVRAEGSVNHTDGAIRILTATIWTITCEGITHGD